MELFINILLIIAAVIAGGLIIVSGLANLAYIFITVWQAVMMWIERHIVSGQRESAHGPERKPALDPRRPHQPLSPEAKERAIAEMKRVEVEKRTRNAPLQ